jgi:hypothetical protein
MNQTQLLQDFETLPPEMQQEALDFIQQLKHKLQNTTTSTSNGKQVAEIMEQIAKRGTAFREIKDPVAWQREIREDRPLPNREI